MEELKVLVLADADPQSVSFVVEKYVPQSIKFDLIILVGPLVHEKHQSPEGIACAVGDCSTMIAQLENIVCRVVYLAGESDPPSVLTDQLNLTPNSVNIYARKINLAPNLFITGFTEKHENLSEATTLAPDSDEEAEEIEGLNLVSGITSIQMIEEILTNSSHPISQHSSLPSPEFGIFMLNYKFSHTLNHLLFHMSPPNIFESSGIKLCLLSPPPPPSSSPSSSSDPPSDESPPPPPSPAISSDVLKSISSSFFQNKLQFHLLPSLKNTGQYSVLHFHISTSTSSTSSSSSSPTLESASSPLHPSSSSNSSSSFTSFRWEFEKIETISLHY